MKEPNHTDPAAILTIEGRAHTLTEPPHTMRLNITPEEELTTEGMPIAGEVYISRGLISNPGLNRFDSILLDEQGALWEVAYFRPPRDENGFFVYAPTTPAEAAQFLTENNALLRAVFGTPPQKPRRGPTIAPDAQRGRRHPEEPGRAQNAPKGH